ncbi:hypothetical protein ABT369_39510 [Dactylosporangium sp. NPDC000244]|uniref:hypothetical protein n=1 Tax=Dactylosporangium sp. NPDC000244 TaxID=3154365 RepID=UPI003327F6E0
MTQTTTAPARYIPATGLTETVNGTTVQAFWVNGAGWKVQARRDGLTVISQLHQHDHQAVAAYNALVAEHTAPVEPAPAVRLAAPAKGTATRMTPAEVVVIGQALDSTGHIRRGRGAAGADLSMLLAMAKRGFITLDGPRFRPTGGEVTDFGKRLYKEAVAAAEAEQQRADHINRILAIVAA